MGNWVIVLGVTLANVAQQFDCSAPLPPNISREYIGECGGSICPDGQYCPAQTFCGLARQCVTVGHHQCGVSLARRHVRMGRNVG
jgi:hypothetical protein